jgi:hypothetical protein
MMFFANILERVGLAYMVIFLVMGIQQLGYGYPGQPRYEPVNNLNKSIRFFGNRIWIWL